MKVLFEYSEEVVRGIRTFWFRPERPVRYVAGQFTEIHLPHDPTDERGIRRWFTLSSSPTEKLVAITTKFAPQDGSSFKRQMLALKPGAPLHLAEPMGDFVLPKDPTIPLVFVAIGLGITPVRSMIKWLIDTGERRQIHLMYAASHEDDLAFLPLFKTYDLQLTTVIKHPPVDYAGEMGSLTTDRIINLIRPTHLAHTTPRDEQSLIYLSGPEPMIETFFKELSQRGIRPERLVTDYFPGYSQI